MADNVTLPGTGSLVATDECTVNAQTVQVQLIKLGYGALDTFSIVTSSAGLPVAQQGTWTVTGSGGTFPVTDSGGSLTVDNAGTFAVQAAQSGTWNVGTVTTVTTVSTVTAVSDAQAQGKAAHDAAVSGNPLLVGVEARRVRMTAVSADGDAVRLAGDRYGRLTVAGVDLTAVGLQATASGDTSLVSAPGAGSRLKVLRVEASNSHATTALTAGLKSASLNSGAVFGKRYLPAAGGAAVWNFPGGHLLCGDNEAFSVNLSGAGQVEFTIFYETIAS